MAQKAAKRVARSQPKLHSASRVLASGGVIAYPTEGVWGLGCDPRNDAAVHRLLALKRRDWRKGLILIAADFSQLQRYIAPLDAQVLQKALATWPGPHTWLFPAAAGAPELITGGRATIAVRVTAHPVASALCRAYGGALVSTSANLAGQPPAKSALQVRLRFGVALDAVVPGALGTLAAPTPIRDLVSGATHRA